ncbi:MULTISPECIES: hypothetical protein [Streptomyces]|uniref:Carbonic anhydrase n=1 Tax=Streptomyces misionensis TaxID=67331 RepID=A0A1H4LZA8_9ACTN|nr:MULTISPECIES: hypothetical protein [Streptomyces]SEB76036.1 hypothetical protein SAMN04490357_0320 [Streptomyces misionensis]SFY52407.1 hypothetical protein STEPF1_05679 [Streptomyces sp. F-1]
MQTLIDNARDFGRRPEEFARLAAGQSPEVLFITCSDSRGRAPARGRLTLHGWYYEVHTGAVRTHRPLTDTFESLRARR